MNIHLRVDNHGIPLAVNVSPANVPDTKAAPRCCVSSPVTARREVWHNLIL